MRWQRLDDRMVCAVRFALLELADAAGRGAPLVGQRAGVGATAVARPVPDEAQELPERWAPNQVDIVVHDFVVGLHRNLECGFEHRGLFTNHGRVHGMVSGGCLDYHQDQNSTLMVRATRRVSSSKMRRSPPDI